MDLYFIWSLSGYRLGIRDPTDFKCKLSFTNQFNDVCIYKIAAGLLSMFQIEIMHQITSLLANNITLSFLSFLAQTKD